MESSKIQAHFQVISTLRDAAVDPAISEAIEEGLISAEEACSGFIAHLMPSFLILIYLKRLVKLSKVANSQWQKSGILEGFNSLSDAGKSVVGRIF